MSAVDPSRAVRTCGIVLAAGAGSRFGMPKALARRADGASWLSLACTSLRAGGCDAVIVVLGARAEEAAALVPAGAGAVVAEDWAHGLSASLRAGLAAAAATTATAAVVVPVDVPGMPASVVARVRAAGAGCTATAGAGAEAARAADAGTEDSDTQDGGTGAEARAEASGVLARAVYRGVPGHPVLIGRAHWAAVTASASGDRGAGPYLRAHRALDVPCDDLWDGADIDVAP